MEDQFVMVEVKAYLTEDEKIAKGSELAEHVSKIEILTEEKADKAKHYKTLIDGHNLEAIGLSISLKNGYEMRQVECKMVKNYAQRSIDFVVVSTGELVQTRPFGAGDDQIGIFDQGAESIDRRKAKITKLGG